MLPAGSGVNTSFTFNGAAVWALADMAETTATQHIVRNLFMSMEVFVKNIIVCLQI